MVFVKNDLALIFSDWQHENVAFHDQMFHMKVYSHHPLYHIPLPKRKKRVFCDAKVTQGPQAPESPFRVLVRFHSDGILLMVLSDKILFESSVIDSSLGSSVLFFRHTAIRCHLLSFVIPLVVTRCHLLSLVLTRCTTRLPF